MKWSEVSEQARTDLIEWYNVCEEDLDSKDRQLLATLYGAGLFHAWNCPDCGERVYVGDPEDWEHFQGVLQADYTSYPGDPSLFTAEHIAKQCDNCRMFCHLEAPDPIGL